MDDPASLAWASLLSGTRTESHTGVPVAVRMATTCREDSAAAIEEAVRELVTTFETLNDAGPRAVRVVIFTATPDLRAAKPATFARAAGWTYAQYLCLAEMPTDDDLPRCLRALLIVDRGPTSPPLRPVYINGAERLRPDFSAARP